MERARVASGLKTKKETIEKGLETPDPAERAEGHPRPRRRGGVLARGRGGAARRQERAAAPVIAVDSGVRIDHLRGDANPEVARLREIIADEETLLVVCDAVLFEVSRGQRHKAEAARVERNLRRSRVEPVSTGPDAAVRAAARWWARRARASPPGAPTPRLPVGASIAGTGSCTSTAPSIMWRRRRACRSSGPDRQCSGTTVAPGADLPPGSPTIP